MTEDTPEVSSFQELGVADDLIASLAADGITTPFPIQSLTIPDGLAGRDVCGQAQTGFGKTVAFGIPLVERTAKARPSAPTSLVLVPTRELCLQVAAEVGRLADARGLRLVAIYGGAPMAAQIKKVEKAEIVVATPGRLIDMAERRHLSLADVSLVVIDEADQMADMGFLPQVHAVMRLVEGDHQTMLFSATLDGAVGSLIRSYMDDPIRYEAPSSTEGRPSLRACLGPWCSSAPSATPTGCRRTSSSWAFRRRRSTATGARVIARRRWPGSREANSRCWWPPTWRPAASTSMTSTS